MATTDTYAHLDRPFLEEVIDYLPHKHYYWCPLAAENGDYQRDRWVEEACAVASKGLFVRDSGAHKDFSDISDMKTNVISYRKSQLDKNGNGKVSIDGVKGKKYLRSMNYDPINETFSYYVIWDWPKSLDCIEFRHNAGISKYSNGECGLEVDSFEELSTFDFSKVC